MEEDSQQRQDGGSGGSFKAIGAFLGTLPGRIATLAGTVIAVAGAWAVLRGEEPAERAGQIVGVSIEQQVSLDEFQGRGVGAPRRCPGFRRPEQGTRAAIPSRPSAPDGLPLASAPPLAGRLLAQEDLPVPLGGEGESMTRTETTGTETTGTETTPTDTEATDTGPIGARSAGKLLREGPLPPSAELAPKLREDEEALRESALRMEIDQDAPGAEAVAQIADRPDLSLQEVNALLETAAPALVGNIVNFVVQVRGLKGKCTYVSAALFDARRRVRLRDPFAAPRDALFFVPRTKNDQTRHEVWVPRPKSRGSYFVRLELFDHSGEGLTFDEQARFRVPID